jgi:hypothetical protein
MTSIVPGGQAGAVGGSASTKAQVQAQLDAIASMLRQLGGNAEIVSGASASTDPLIAPFTIYVNPYIGSDEFAAGTFNSFESSGTDEEKIAQKLKRLHNQHLTCGFSPQRPFRTINRAAIEAAIITSRDYYTFSDPRAQVDCVLIRLSAGRHIIYNDPGNSGSAIAVSEWADGFIPTIDHLIAFNPNEGGVLLPRGASFNGDDLRKCVFSPSYVPTPADETSNYSNRSTILRVTPLALGGQFTFTDKLGATTSHHLLDCIAFSTQAQLNAFYTKVYTACGSGANLGEALMVARPTEYQVVGPIEGLPAPAWDTTGSASPYMFNLSIRSDYGLCGCFLDGDQVEGLRSLVTAQFTGVSLQKDMNCWEIYSGGSWITPTYTQYIEAQPDNVRMKPARRSRHLTAINDAFVQAVSVFCIGQGIGYMTDEGGEVTVTNSNSSFGGCAALSKGYKRASFPQDSNWASSRIKVARTPSEKTSNIKRIYIGRVDTLSTSPNRIILDAALESTTGSTTVPDVLSAQGYTFRNGTQIWIENTTGDDWRAQLTSSAWSTSDPTYIELSAQPVEASGSPVLAPADAVGKRVYIRRLVDTRSTAERRWSLQISNTTSARIPERNYVLQTDPARVGGAISRVLNKTTELLLVTKTGAGPTPGPGVNRTAEITLRRGAASVTYAQNTYYPKGTVVKASNKHWQNTAATNSPTALPEGPLWIETFVHQPSAYNPEDNNSNETPILIFDTDTATTIDSTTLGINWSTIFTSAGDVQKQYRSGTDYLGMHAFLVAMGLSSANAHTALLPRTEATRLLDPSNATDFPNAPSGGAATGRGNWAVEFRRPSALRLYGHAWEWAGWLNYSKAIPVAQQQLSVFNKFTYYFTNEAGGRVVPQGSNEDGFNVSPRGLEDVETGAQVSVDDLNAPPIDLPTFDTDITITNLTVVGILNLSDVTSISGAEELFPYLPIAGASDADITLRSLGLGQAVEVGFELALNGAAKGNVIALGSGTAIDCRLGNYFSRAMAGNLTFTFTNPPATGGFTFTLEIAYTSGALTLPASARFVYGLAPDLVAGNTYQLVCTTINGGTRWNVIPLEFPTA